MINRYRKSKKPFPRVCGGDPAALEDIRIDKDLFPACAGVILCPSITEY